MMRIMKTENGKQNSLRLAGSCKNQNNIVVSVVEPRKQIKIIPRLHSGCVISKLYNYLLRSLAFSIKHSALAIIFVIAASFTFLSCDDSIDPKTLFKERYILNFVVRGDTTYQVATLSHSYDVDGVDPYTNETDPAIADADVKIWYNGDVITMRDTTMERTDTSRYKTAVNYYYINNFTPGIKKDISVKVELNSGRTLTAQTTLPADIEIDSSDRIIPLTYKDQFCLVWQRLEEPVYYFLRFRIYYKYNSVITAVEVPLTYEYVDGKPNPVYPGISKSTAFNYQKAALDTIMKKISEGNGNKSAFAIMRAEYEVVILDKNLSDYYSSTHGYMDNYSVRTDVTDYTNITGGYGIFASYRKEILAASLKEDYILSFGYTVGSK